MELKVIEILVHLEKYGHYLFILIPLTIFHSFMNVYYAKFFQSLPGINSAREFVWWYNGHPDYSNFSPELKNTDTAIILGQVYIVFSFRLFCIIMLLIITMLPLFI